MDGPVVRAAVRDFCNRKLALIGVNALKIIKKLLHSQKLSVSELETLRMIYGGKSQTTEDAHVQRFEDDVLEYLKLYQVFPEVTPYEAQDLRQRIQIMSCSSEIESTAKP